MHTRMWHNAGHDSQLHLLYTFNATANVKIQETVITHQDHATGVVVISERLIPSKGFELLTIGTEELRAG